MPSGPGRPELWLAEGSGRRQCPHEALPEPLFPVSQKLCANNCLRKTDVQGRAPQNTCSALTAERD